MLSPLWATVIILAVAGVAIIMTIVLAWLMRKYRKLKLDYEDLAEIVHGLNNDFRDLYTATLAVDERIISTDMRINAFDDQVSLLAQKVNEFQQTEPSSHPYGLAIQKVRSGASVSELMQTAGLSQDEAALLIRLHGSKTR